MKSTSYCCSVSLLASSVLVASVLSSEAVNVVITGVDNSEIETFLATYYTNANVTASGDFADFSSTATQNALAAGGGAELVIIGRSLTSSAYGGGAAAGYNGLGIPVISFTSYVSRSSGGRLGWHTESATNDKSVAGAETTLTAAGAGFLGVPAGNYDFFDTNEGGTFNGLGTGTALVGDGLILATIGGDILSAYWPAGAAPGDPVVAGVPAFPGERLLLNLDDDPRPTGIFTAPTPLGLDAVVSAVGQVGGLTIVPEPSAAILGLLGLGLLGRWRRR